MPLAKTRSLLITVTNSYTKIPMPKQSQNRFFIITAVIILAILGWLVLTKQSTKQSQLAGRQLTGNLTPLVEKRLFDYKLTSKHNLIIISALNNQFQQLNEQGSIVRSWPGDYYINPQFLWSPDQQQVIVSQQPANPEPPLPIIIYNLISNKTIALPSSIVSANWKNDQEILAQKQNPDKQGGTIVVLDNQGVEQRTLGSSVHWLGKSVIFSTDGQDTLIAFEPIKNYGKLSRVSTRHQILQFETISRQASQPIISPDQKQLIFSEIGANGQPAQTLLYQIDQNKSQTLPFKTIGEKMVWLDNRSILAGLPKATELAGEKLVRYTLNNHQQQVITESTARQPLQFSHLQFDDLNKNRQAIFFIDRDFLYKIEIQTN